MTTEPREWRVVVRKPTANRFQPTHFEGTWAEASRLANAIGILTELDVYYVHKADTTVLTHTGSQVAIKGEAIFIEDLLEPCRHNLASIEGYTLRIGNGKYHTNVFYRAFEYALAVESKAEALERGRRALISNLYSCGHWSEDLDRYYTERRAS